MVVMICKAVIDRDIKNRLVGTTGKGEGGTI